MYYTDFQKKVLRDLGYCKVLYKRIYKSKKELGYTTIGKNEYDITLASDVPEDIKKIVLIHEVGHVYYGHMNVNLREEFVYIKSLLEKYNKPLEALLAWGGFNRFVNICMDLEVNSKLFTVNNIEIMQSFGFPPCTIDTFNVDYKDTYKEYYEELIKSDETPNQDQMNAMSKMINDMLDKLTDEDIQDLMNNMNDGSSKGSSGSNYKEIAGKDYKGGNEQAEENKNEVPSESEDVDSEVDKDESQGKENANKNKPPKKTNSGRTAGTSKKVNEQIEIADDSVSEIRNFLLNIFKYALNYMPDSMKHYNRGTRPRDNGLLYNSFRRKLTSKRRKLGVLVDVSGSMDPSNLIKGLSSIKEVLNMFSSDSKLVTWNTDLVEEFDVMKLPSNVDIGGGTDMYEGLQYLVDNGYTDIVVYSDMETEVSSMNDLIKKSGIRVYTIQVNYTGNEYNDNKKSSGYYYGNASKDLLEYRKLNKKTLLLEKV